MMTQRTVVACAVMMAVGCGAVEAAAIPTYQPTSTTGNNLTALGGTGLLNGGTNDVIFSWDGTLHNSVVTDGSSNAAISSPTSYFGIPWTMHHVNIYGPGTYTFKTGCPAGDPACSSPSFAGSYTLTIPTGYIGAHMLRDFSTTTNNDLVMLWQLNAAWPSSSPFCAAPLTTGGCNTNPNPNGNSASTVWSLLSVDTPIDTNSYPGTAQIDGPTQGANWNFNLMANFTPVPIPGAIWLLGGGLTAFGRFFRKKT